MTDGFLRDAKPPTADFTPKVKELFRAFASKRLVAVDLPGPSSNQHELNGVGGLRQLFGVSEKRQSQIEWFYFSEKQPTRSATGRFTFYDARAKSASRTGRSEWRFYYDGSFLTYAKVGDLLVLGVIPAERVVGLIFERNSSWFAAATVLFGVEHQSSEGFSPGTIADPAILQRALNESTARSDRLRAILETAAPTTVEKSTAPLPERSVMLPFKPRARMLLLMGDQLIRDSGIAVFELAKNAFDADASRLDVVLSHVSDQANATITVEDDGCGMDWETVVNVWLEPGTDYRLEQKKKEVRTRKYGRLPLGEKGIGRFAAHKLGKKIRMITRMQERQEVVVDVDWNEFVNERYLADAQVRISERPPVWFAGQSTGTRIEISDLNDEISRGTIRQISRAITSLCSPFKGPAEFHASLQVLPDGSPLRGLLDLDKVLELAPYRATCLVDGGTIAYDYEFVPLAGMERTEPRTVRGKRLEIPEFDLFSADDLTSKVGPLLLEFRIYDLDPGVLSYAVADKKGFKEFLQQNGGVRVYRDGVRIYDYGEPGNDWLDLSGSRVNAPTARISNNQIIGAVHLDGVSSRGMIEKTNREGFIEDSTYGLFRQVVLFALTQIIHERNIDKQRLRLIYSRKTLKEPVIADLGTLRAKLEPFASQAPDIIPLVDGVAEQYRQMRDTLLTAAGTGLTLSVVIHEVEKAIKGLSVAVEREASVAEMRNLATHLNELIEGLTYLTRKSGRKSETFGALIRQAQLNTAYRIRSHRITFINGLDAEGDDISVKCTRRLIIATLMNLIDNSIYWLSTKSGGEKRIYIGASEDIIGGPVLFVADNGPGFQDPPETLIEPFITRKPEGMGLGLHIAREVMGSHGGRLIFPSREELNLDAVYTGAIVGLQFPEEK